MIPEQQQHQSQSASEGTSSHNMTGTAADELASAAVVPTDESAVVAEKPLKGLLKSSPPSGGTKSKKKVSFSETLLVFCDDWPVELMPQIIALKSPSDFNLLEVAAQGYMFEPPIEYQDVLSFDPPPDYRDISNQQNEESEAGASGQENSSSGSGTSPPVQPFLISDPADESSMYWQSVILNEKESLEEDAIIGVLKEDAILQAIGARHAAVFQPPVCESGLSEVDFPVHYSDQPFQDANVLSSLSPASSTSSLNDANQKTSTENAANNSSVKAIVTSNGEPNPQDPVPIVSSPIESAQELASDSSFASQDTIIIMTKEILKGNISPFDDCFDDCSIDADKETHLPEDTCNSEDERARSSTPASASDDSSSIGRFRISSCPDGSHESATKVSCQDNVVHNDVVPPADQSHSVSSSNSAGESVAVSSNDCSSGRFSVVLCDDDTEHVTVKPAAEKGSSVSQAKKAPPPPPAKPSAAVIRQHLSSLQPQPKDPDASDSVTQEDKIPDKSENPPTQIPRSGSVPNAAFSVSEIRKSFEKRGVSLDHYEMQPAVPINTKEQRPKSFPNTSDSVSLLLRSELTSYNSQPQQTRSEAEHVKSETMQMMPKISSDQQAVANDPANMKAESLVRYSEEPRALVPSKRTSSLANFNASVPATATLPSSVKSLPQHQPYRSLNRQGLIQINNQSVGSQAGPSHVQHVQPPTRTSSVQASVPAPQVPARSVQREVMCGQIVRTQQVLMSQLQQRQQPQQQSAHLPANTVSPNAIYGYIRKCDSSCPAANHIHYHQPQMVLSSGHKLTPSADFPRPSEIRRRDGINAFPNVVQESPASMDQSVGSSGRNDELEEFVQQERDRTERIRQRYNQNEENECGYEDPTFGFGKRPAVRGIRTDQPVLPNSPFLSVVRHPYINDQVFIRPVSIAYPQQQQQQQTGANSLISTPPANQQTLPPNRQVFLVHNPYYNTMCPVRASLPQHMIATGPISQAPVQNVAGANSQPDRPVSSVGHSAPNETSCPQCLGQRLAQGHPNVPMQAAFPANTAANSLLAFKTISMPNVAMIRPVQLLVQRTDQQQQLKQPQPSPPVKATQQVHSNCPTETPQHLLTHPRTSASASAALSSMSGNKTPVHNNNPDLVIDATSRTSICAQPVGGPDSSPQQLPSSSSSSSANASTSSFLRLGAKKDDKSKDDKKKSKKEKKKQTKEGLIYYSMNV